MKRQTLALVAATSMLGISVGACTQEITFDGPGDGVDLIPDDDDDDDIPTVDDLEPRGRRPSAPFGAPPARLRRLLDHQYQAAVAQIVGPEVANLALPPPDVPLNGFMAVGAAELALSGIGVDRYEESANVIAAASSVDVNSPARAICQQGNAACYEDIARTLGRRAFRRSLTPTELAAYTDIATTAHDGYVGLVDAPFNKGLEFLLYALLQSPNFLYIVEAGEGADATARRLTGAELATRLSFFVTGTPPSDDLLAAGEAGQLTSLTAREAAVRELLTEPEARAALRSIFRERFAMADLPELNRPEPELTPSVRAAMVEESLRFIDDIVWDRNADLRELFTSTTTFVNDELASYYGFALPGSGPQFARVPTPPEQGRAGLLTRGAFLVRFAHNNRSSPTLRGKYIRENLLCSSVPAPPGDVITVLPDSEPQQGPQTTRQRLSAHVEDPSCATCHSAMDPLGFSLEHFDQYGRYRTHENGLPVDASAELDGDEAPGSREFMNVLRRRTDMVSCVVRTVYRAGLGSLESDGQAAALYDIDTVVISSGLRLQEAMVQIALSDVFALVDVTAVPATPAEED